MREEKKPRHVKTAFNRAKTEQKVFEGRGMNAEREDNWGGISIRGHRLHWSERKRKKNRGGQKKGSNSRAATRAPVGVSRRERGDKSTFEGKRKWNITYKREE